MSTLLYVLFAATITALFTGFGALPFAFRSGFSGRSEGVFNAIAGGLMLGASVGLLIEAIPLSIGMSIAGSLAGVVLVRLGDRLVHRVGEPSVADLQGANSRRALLILGVMTAHSFAEGVGVGVSFAETRELGTFISATIALHNIPEGLAISLILIPRGTAVWKAGLWSVISSVPQPIMAVPAFLFVSVFREYLPFGLGLAAGAMFFMVSTEIVPDARNKIRAGLVGVVVFASAIVLLLIQFFVLKG